MDSKPSNEDLKSNNLISEKQIKTLKYAEKINYTLYDISNAVNITHNLEELYQSIYNSLNKLMLLPNFFIAIYDNKTKTINFEYLVDEYDDDFPIIENLEKPNCLTGEVILTKRPLFLKENMLIERAKKNRLMGTIPKIWLGVPLVIQDKVIGVIAVQSYTDPDYFSYKDLEILVSVSDQIAIAIERKQTLDALEKKEKALHESEERFSQIFDTSPESTITTNLEDQKPKSVSETILVIEDEDVVRDMAVKTLKSFGYNTLEASDGEIGLGIYKKNHHLIDAVLLDVIMPKMSGIQTFKQMLKINPHVKVIIASGHITNQDQKKMFAKACAYLDKPYQIIELKQALRSIFE